MDSQSVVTYKLKYTTSDECKELIHNYLHQYSCALHYAYNRINEDMREIDVVHRLKGLNHLDLMDAYFVACATKEARYIKDSVGEGKIIFGGIVL